MCLYVCTYTQTYMHIFIHIHSLLCGHITEVFLLYAPCISDYRIYVIPDNTNNDKKIKQGNIKDKGLAPGCINMRMTDDHGIIMDGTFTRTHTWVTNL